MWITDYELGFINVIGEEFPNCQKYGCFFHFVQSLWRNIASRQLRDAYTDEPDFAIQCKLFGSLAFVPLADVEASFQMIINHPGYDARLADFADYFQVSLKKLF
jgi:hypothetical protein